MKQPKPSPVEAVRATLPLLVEDNKGVKQEIAEIADIIAMIERSLRKIGLDVSAWYKIAGGSDDESGDRWSREIGYTRYRNSWSILLRESSGNLYDEEGDEVNTYAFSTAPPWMCIEAAGKIPELLQELLERTRTTKTSLAAKKLVIQGVANEIAALVDGMSVDAKGGA